MKKRIIPCIAAAVLFSGCAGTKPLNPAFYALGTSTVVAYGIRNSPQTAEYLRAFQPVACSLASGAPLTPGQITQALDAASLAGTPEAKAVANSIVLLYIVAYNSLGTNAYAAQPYAQAIFCDGLANGLGLSPTAARIRAMPALYASPKAEAAWPLLK